VSNCYPQIPQITQKYRTRSANHSYVFNSV
jgi:hypothetical protein